MRAASSRCLAARRSSSAPAAPHLGLRAKTMTARQSAGETGEWGGVQALAAPRIRAGSTVPVATMHLPEAPRAGRPHTRGVCRISAREMPVGRKAPRATRARIVARAPRSRRRAALARHTEAASRASRAPRGSMGLLGIRQIALVETGTEDDNSLETLVFAAFVRRTA